MSGQGTTDMHAYLGEPGSGKSTRMKVRLYRDKPRRVMVFDPKGEFTAPFVDLVTHDTGALARAVIGRAAFRVAYVPPRTTKQARAAFDLFCQIADHAKRLHVVVDELARVTEAGWAPDGWEMLSGEGRAFGIVLMGASQMPAAIDKRFLSNCSQVHTFRLTLPAQVDYMARFLEFDRDRIRARCQEIATLGDHESLVLTKNPRQIEKIVTPARDLKRVHIGPPL